jgi:hypothetical protein
MSADPTSASQQKAKELRERLEALEQLLKDPEVAPLLAAAHVNASLALTAVQGLLAYVQGDKVAAAEDFEVVAEEIRARMLLSRPVAEDVDH